MISCILSFSFSSNVSPIKKLPVNVCKLMFRRETNLTGVGKFRKSDCCHLGMRHIPQHDPKVREVMNSRGYIGQYSDDGEWFISGWQDRRIKIHDVHNDWSTRKDIVARQLRWTITDTCMSPDNSFLVYSSITPFVHMVSTAQRDVSPNIDDDKEHYKLQFGGSYDSFGIWGISFSPDGREIVAGTSDERLIVYDVETNKIVRNINAHKDDVNSVAFVDQSSNIVVSGSDDCLCKVWDKRMARTSTAPGTGSAEKSSAAGVFVGHSEGVAHVSPKGDGRYFISNAKDQSIKLWDLRGMLSEKDYSSQKKPGIPKYHWDYRWMEYPPFTKSGLTFQKHEHDASIMTFRGHAVLETLIRSYFSPLHTTGQRYIYSGSHDGRIYIFDVVTGDIIALLKHHISVVRDCSWHPFEAKLTSCSWDGTIIEWSYNAEEKCSPPSLPGIQDAK